MSSDIADSIADALRRSLPAEYTFEIRVVYTADCLVDSLTPRRRFSRFHAEATQSRRMLALVSQEGCLVAGLLAHELTSLVCEMGASGSEPCAATVGLNVTIEKLDTSGELTARVPLARSLVAGYLQSLHPYRNALGVASVGVHLFARAQPEYLFAQSQRNPGKRMLRDMALVKWWCRALQFALPYASTEPTTAHCVVPGSINRECKSWFPSEKDATAGVVWKWGLPYSLHARAHDSVLQFPDDPITRLMTEPHSDNWSVSTLLDMLAVSEECGSGHPAAYFSASMPLIEKPAQESNGRQCSKLTFDDFDDILIKLFDHKMDFSDHKSSVQSTTKFLDYLDTKFDTSLTTVKTTGESANAGHHTPTKDVPQAVNDLTMMVRKKKRKTAN